MASNAFSPPMPTCSSNSELRRARPILGTLVEITLPASSIAPRALERAFAVITRVHHLMSAHESTSDLGRISAAQVGRVVYIDPWTWRVLAYAQKFSQQSEGAFDVAATSSPQGATWNDLELLPNRRSVRCQRALRLDLGGIAKGFAVDQAVRNLRRAGIQWGLVNAGGDLRGFGPRTWPLQVRHPSCPGALLPLAPFQNVAVATSAPYFSQRRHGGYTISDLVDPRDHRYVVGSISATVIAPTALIADAMTKIMLLSPTKADKLLRSYHARAIIHRPQTETRHAC